MTVAHFAADQAKLPGASEFRERWAPTRDVNGEQHLSLSAWERVAAWVTDRVGTMQFFTIIVAWTVLWLGWNLLAPLDLRFDPGPAFVLWLFVSTSSSCTSCRSSSWARTSRSATPSSSPPPTSR